MKLYDTYGTRKREFLDIVLEVEEVKVKLPSVVSFILIQSGLEKNNFEVSKGNTLLLMNINHILKPDTFTILA